MCRLYGFSSDKKYKLGPTLKEFFKGSVYHPDGWGVGFYDQGAHVYKEPIKADQNSGISKFIELKSNLCIAHIRKSTVGKNQLENTHPFTAMIRGKEWIFAHNGTVSLEAFRGMDLDPKGTTDSELCFLYIKRRLEFEKNEETAIEKAVEHLSKHGKFNMLLTDGKRMYYHTNMANTLYRYKSEGLMCLVTQRLSTVKDWMNWKRIKLNTLFACENGKIVYAGNTHNFEYKKLTK